MGPRQQTANYKIAKKSFDNLVGGE